MKTFEDLELDTIMEIVDDLLIHTHHRDECIEFISTLEMITIDIVKAIVNEVNIHNNPPSVFKDIFNVRARSNKFNIYLSKPGNPLELLYREVKLNINKFEIHMVNQNFIIAGEWEGTIKTVLNESTAIIKNEDDELVTYVIEPVETRHKAFVI